MAIARKCLHFTLFLCLYTVHMVKMVSVIIPAYNEARRIGKALRIMRRVHIVGEIIVVDDGSQDATTKKAQQLADIVLTLPRNFGKSYAMRAGALRAGGDILLFCDADMFGFTPRDIKQLCAPLIKGSADMSLGLRR